MDSKSTRKSQCVDQMNDEFYSLYRTFRDEKMTNAVETVAEMCSYGSTRAWEIVGIREGSGKP
jgi:hypothetical protein